VRKKEFQELVPSKCDDPEINSIELNIYFFFVCFGDHQCSVNKFLAFYATLFFNTAISATHHQSLS
jgi:hypothetical protein